MFIGDPCRVNLVVAFSFCSKILAGSGDLWMVHFHSMNAGLSGKDIQNLPAVIEFIQFAL